MHFWEICQQLWVLVSGCLFIVQTLSEVFVVGDTVLFLEFVAAQRWPDTQSDVKTESGSCKHEVQGPIFKNYQMLKIEPSFSNQFNTT